MTNLQETCMEVFNFVSSTTSIFIIPIFLGRIAVSNITGGGFKALNAIKGVVLYFVLIEGFPILLDILFSIPESFLPKQVSLSPLGDQNPGWQISSIPFLLDKALEVILAGLYWIIYYLHIFFMLLMSSMAPIVFLLSTLLGVGLGLEVFIGLLIVGSSWPIIWYGFDQVHTSLSLAQSNAFGSKCLELILTILKGIGPIAFAALAVRSPIGRSITQATQMAANSGMWVKNVATNSVRDLTDFSRKRPAQMELSYSAKEQRFHVHSYGSNSAPLHQNRFNSRFRSQSKGDTN